MATLRKITSVAPKTSPNVAASTQAAADADVTLTNETVSVHPVRLARTAAGYTQQSLADTIGVTRQTVISIEAGDYGPSVILALRIARCCQTTVEELWGPTLDSVI